MYKRLSAILFPIVTIFLIGTAFWGYQEHQEKNAVLLKAENQYQRAFHDLSYHLDQLNTELGSAVAVGEGGDWHRKCLLNVWRLTSEAQNEVNQLPLTLMPFNKTEEFLANISNFSYRTAMRDLKAQPLTADEKKTLTTLFERSKEISGHLRDVQESVLAENLRWMDVEVALASQNENMDNTIVDGFMTVDKQVNAYDEVNWGPSMASLFEKRSFSALGGQEVSPEQVKQAAANFLGMKNPTNMEVVENGAGTEFSSYSVTVPNAQQGRGIQMDFTKQGGRLIYFMNPRQVAEKKLTIDQASDRAHQFLMDKGYGDMEPVSYDQYQNVVSLTFVTVQDGILIMPERVVVKVALDNGEVTALHAADYIYEHKQRNLPKPAITADEARKSLNGDFKVTEEEVALIKNDMKEETLTYEFTGTMMGGLYKAYINAVTGIHEKVEKIREEDAKLDVRDPNQNNG
ncbi:germination protein YpeB [Paenibacillus turpanensis]|uniref:germination protein YpeB n=1 Tax=Paenibacillus turpanensis TaxID=2689078 RepID=UPI00140BA0AB|nr:germination protein YpeB [Paenibacillus turpanensis]